MQLEMTFYSATNQPFTLASKKDLWDRRMKTIEDVIVKTDDEIMKAMETNYKETLDELIIRNQRLTGFDLAKFLFTKLSEKFSWRNWYVVVGKDTGASDDVFYVQNCNDGYSRFNFYGKQIAVNHGDPVALVKNTAQVLINNAQAKFNRAPLAKSNAKFIHDAMRAKCDDNTKMVIVAEAHDGLAMAIPEGNVITGVSETQVLHQRPKSYLKIIVGP